jgi:hypothetical protein
MLTSQDPRHERIGRFSTVLRAMKDSWEHFVTESINFQTFTDQLTATHFPA